MKVQFSEKRIDIDLGWAVIVVNGETASPLLLYGHTISLATAKEVHELNVPDGTVVTVSNVKFEFRVWPSKNW